MTDQIEEVPAIVKELARMQNMHPIKWHIEGDHITIIYQEGPKIRYDRPGAVKTGPNPHRQPAQQLISEPSLPVAKPKRKKPAK